MAERKEEHENRPGASLSSHSIPVVESPLHPHIDEAKLLRKTDLRVMPMLFVVYIVAFLDRYVLTPLSNGQYQLSIESIYPMLSQWVCPLISA